MMNMLTRETEQRQAIEMLRVDMLAPKEHLLRKSDAAVDFTRIYALVEALYCEDNGRPSCAPVALFKLVPIQRLHSLSAEQNTELCNDQPRGISGIQEQKLHLQKPPCARTVHPKSTARKDRSPAYSLIGKATCALRSQTIERVFADAKQKHAMRYMPYRG